MREWQPIETAPQITGRHMLLWTPGDKCTYAGLWWEDSWQSFAFGVIRPLLNKPTHWRPMPANPA